MSTQREQVPAAVCVYCGSRNGGDERYRAAARRLAAALVARDLTLVYGGASVGLMGTLADAVLDGDGRVVGVIPGDLVTREVAHAGLTELHVVDSMHQRKALMAGLADGFVALPGGLGTFEELFEILTWGQLGLHDKPCGALNVADYFSPLTRLLDDAAMAGFVTPEHRELLTVADDPEDLFGEFATRRPDVFGSRAVADRT